MDTPARLAAARWLGSPAAIGPLRAATEHTDEHPRDPLAAAAALRRGCPGLSAEQAAALLEQADLRRLGRDRYGIHAEGLLLTRDGLEQATRVRVAARRAALFTTAGARRVLDLTAGLGFDASAFDAAGLTVVALERDPVTAVLLAHNCPDVEVEVGDATDPAVLEPHLARLGPADVVFADPARRDPAGPRGATLRAQPERDPDRWSPPWSYLHALPHPRIAAKVAPAFRPPPGWHAEWVSVERTVVECAVYSWPVFDAPARAVVWQRGTAHVLDSSHAPVPYATGEAGPWLHEPDPAVRRAGAIATLLQSMPGVVGLDAQSTWLTGSAADQPVVRSYRLLAELGGSAKEQRRTLDRLHVRSVTVKSKDVDIAPSVILRDLGRPEGPGHVVVVTRRAGRTIRLLCDPSPGRSA